MTAYVTMDSGISFLCLSEEFVKSMSLEGSPDVGYKIDLDEEWLNRYRKVCNEFRDMQQVLESKWKEARRNEKPKAR
jgi:hypothetical protein